MSTVSLNGFVGAMIGPSCGVGVTEPVMPLEPAAPTLNPGLPPATDGSGVLPVTAGMVVIVVIVDEDELVLLVVFMPISMLVNADDTCSRFSIRIW